MNPITTENQIRSYSDIEAFERQYPEYSGLLVTALLKDRNLVGRVFTKDGPVCFRKSDTFLAAISKKSLRSLFDESGAVEAWLHWTDAFRAGVPIFGIPKLVMVDWASGVFRLSKPSPKTQFAFGCVADIKHGLYDRRERLRRVRLRPPTGEQATASIEDSSALSLDPLTDLDRAKQSLASETETTRKTLIDARLGQGVFRSSLLSLWADKCAVTKCATKVLLRASHIKPWRDCDNRERLDRYNGLLLNPVLDAAFDRGLISFSDTGGILFSCVFSLKEQELLGLHSRLKLICVFDENKRYLAFHRKLHGFTA